MNETTNNTTTDTVIISKPNGEDKLSSFLGVSIRGWLAAVLVVTVCINQFLITLACLYEALANKNFSNVGTYTTIGEPLYSMGVAALGFYFGQKTTK